MLLFHVAVSLLAIALGLWVMIGMFKGQRQPQATAWFLATTVLTSLTGFALPAARLLPSHGIGAISLALLAVALYARYLAGLAGRWRGTYVGTALASLYLNVFVLVVQAFRQIPPLHTLAPNQSEPPFALAQLLLLVAFVYAGRRAQRGFPA